MLGAFLAEAAKGRSELVFNIAAGSRKASGKIGNYTVNGREISAETFERSYGAMVKMINDPQEGDVGSANGHNFIYRNGEYYTESTKSGIYDTKITQVQVARDSGLLNYTNVTAPSLDDIDLEIVEAETETETGVPYPKRSITSSNFEKQESISQVLYDIEETYKDYPGFKFEIVAGQLLITAPDGEKKYIEMNIKLTGNKESRDQIQAFIALHAKTEEK